MIAVVDSAPLAADYRYDFEQLIRGGTAEGSGRVEPAWHDGIRAWFTPGHGEDLSHRIGAGDRPRPPPSPCLLAGPDRAAA